MNAYKVLFFFFSYEWWAAFGVFFPFPKRDRGHEGDILELYPKYSCTDLSSDFPHGQQNVTEK
jgi:hypothetical protein